MKSKTYEEFVEKFKPKKTTDDCMTPPAVYDAILEWVCNEYGVKKDNVVRPFWPGADYQKTEYPEGCVVVDNPPFSILSKICEWYLDKDIKFFLFAPSLTALSGKNVCMKMNHIICDSLIEYENGAKVKTAFLTNLGDNQIVFQTCPSLGKIIKEISKKKKEEKTKRLPKYDYPFKVLTAAMMQKYSAYGIDFKVKKSECVQISELDDQKVKNKGIFGSGLLLSDKAAKRHKQAAKEAKEAKEATFVTWMLSERELKIIDQLNEVNTDE